MKKGLKILIYLFVAVAVMATAVGAQVLSSGQLNNPYKLAVSSGFLYSVDTANNQIKKFDPSGNLLYAYGMFGSADGQFNQPQGIAVDSNGYVYVVDTGNQRIQKLFDDGSSFAFVQSITDIPELSDSTFLYPRSIRVNDDGDIFIVDSAKNRVIKYASGTVIGGAKGGMLASSVGGGSGTFNAPYGAAIDDDGYVYIADTENHKVKKYSSSGQLLLEFGSRGQGKGEFLYPCDVAIGLNGNIYVADTGNHRIQKFDRFGRYLATIGSLGISAGKFFAPRGIFVSDDAYLYVVGADNRIQKIDYLVHVTNLSVSEPIISPNQDEVKDGTGIKFTLSEAASVDVSVYDAAGSQFIAQAAAKDLAGGENTVTWQGVDAKGDPVADGEYTIRVSARSRDGAKDSVPVETKVKVDLTPPEVSAVLVAKPIFSPLKTSTEVSFKTFDKNFDPLSNYVVEIRNEADETLATLQKAKSVAAGTLEVSWDGKDEAGSIMPDGCYKIALMIEDGVGNKTEYLAAVETDTVPPVLSATQNLYAFSPNGDGKYDSVAFALRSNEEGTIYFQQLAADGSALLLDEEIAVTAHAEHELEWPADPDLTDGAYPWKAEAVDQAGNISEGVTGQTIIDTAPPAVLAANVAPDPFTPDDDGVKDTTTFSYQFTEPAYVTLNIYRDDGKLFRKHEGPSENFVFPTLSAAPEPGLSGGSWTWDGKGSRNELLGGSYTYELLAEDWVGNAVSSESQTIVVDRAPSLVPYAYAEPDPFSPVNPSNSYTEIVYYLGRDNLNVSVSIQGENDSAIKTLLENETQNKGEHSVRWDGDFKPGYEGSKAAKNEYRVGDGSYQFLVHAEDPDGGQPADVTNTVLADNTPPYVAVKPLAVDYVSKVATLAYNIPENSAVEVEVYDEDDSLIDTLLAAEDRSPGDYTLEYEFGHEASGTNKRYLRIVATDRAKNIAEKTTELFAVDPDQLQVAGHQAVPATFTPNGDGHSDLLRLDYTLSGGVPDYEVSINILNSIGSTIKRLIENETQTPDTYSFYWDGKNDSGQFVADDNYEYEILVEDEIGAKAEGRGTVLAVATRPTVGLSTNYPIFSPDGDGAKDMVILSYSIDYPMEYIAGEALVKLEVLNAEGEAVWDKIFNHTAGTYSYEYDGKDSAGVQLAAGNYYVQASAEDALGSTAVPVLIDLAVDYTLPEPSDFAIAPLYAKLGADVRVALDFGEELAEAPSVSLTLSNAETRTASLISSEGNSYEYSYVILDGDVEGTVTVVAEARDLAFNPVSRSKEFVIDKTDPQISSVSLSPDPASIPEVSGQVSIKFNVSEPLHEVPKVNVTQNGLAPRSAFVSGDWDQAGGQCEAKYDVVSGNDGAAVVNIEVSDLAENIFADSYSGLLTIDTIDPSFSNIVSEISTNPEFSNYAQEGSIVNIRFQTSEYLEFNPEVKVNDNPADYVSLIANEYTYTYTVDSSDDEGNATLLISGLDFAGNEGVTETSSAAESFVIDLVNPTVAIADPGSGLIANPKSFATNAKPDGSDRPRSTNLYYELAEYSKVTVRVYKVGDSQTTYVKEDFNAANLIATLVNDVWQEGGAPPPVAWDGSIADNKMAYDTNNDNYADAGKYAFIVEGRDKAGNLTLKKWGGTVWIQNNVLTLRDPDQRSETNNPDPKNISPNGNSIVDEQKRARLYFYIDLALDPAVTPDPERIEAMEVEFPTKKIGTYSVKVYSDAGLTNLVRTVVASADARAATNTWEDWLGKDKDGLFVADGTYYMAVDVRDFAGNPAVDNLLVHAVTVDNTLPVVSNLSVTPDHFAPGSTNSSLKTTDLDYDISDNSGKAQVTVDVYKGAVFEKTVSSETWRDNGSYLETWDGSGQTGYVGVANGSQDGVYTLKVSAVDEAGNSAVVGAQDVVVDTEGPVVNLGGQAPTAWYSPNNAITASLSDTLSYAGYKLNWGSWPANDPAGANTAVSLTTYHPAQDKIDLYLRVWDTAGNRTDVQNSYWRDHTIPGASFGGQAAGVWYSPDNQITVGFSDSGGSGYRGYKSSWSGWPSTDPNDCQTATSLTTNHGNQGARTLYVRAWDMTGNRRDESRTYYRDSVAPQIAITGISANPFNPYVDDNVRIDFSASDAAPSSGFSISNISASIKYGTNTVKTLDIIDEGGGNYHVIWNGTNGSGDYENDGVYTLEIVATDGVGNQTISNPTINLNDGQGLGSGKYPALGIDGPNLYFDWANGETFNPLSETVNMASALSVFQHNFSSINIDQSQMVTLTMSGGLAQGIMVPNDCGEVWFIIKNSSGIIVYQQHLFAVQMIGVATNFNAILGAFYSYAPANNIWISPFGQAPFNFSDTVSLDPGDYTCYVSVKGRSAAGGISTAALQVDYTDHKYQLYRRVCGPEYAKNIVDEAHYQQTGPTPADNYPVGKNQGSMNGTTHSVWIENGDVYYRRDNSPSVMIEEGIDFGYHSPVIAVAQNGDAYVAWVSSFGLSSGIGFQKVPWNFARARGTAQGASIVGSAPPVILQAGTFEAPTLVAPKDITDPDYQDVSSLRPTFKWQHHKLDTQEYLIDLAENDTFTLGPQTFTKAPNAGSPDEDDTTLYHYTYSIHEFDPGLDRGTYYWRVTANATSESATSEVRSFTVAPQLTLTGVTNYPNPFDPNREVTKLRYRLGADADSVKIRIYDVTGSLVIELDGTTAGESSSVWDKYNDVAWDGKNGRGDIVVNGIYPFEIIARLGSRSVSGRGKIAVLK